MNRTDFIAAAPLLILAGASVLVMLAIAVRRSHTVVALLALAGVAASALAVLAAARVGPRTVTPLLLVDGLALFFFAAFALAAVATLLLSYRYLAEREIVREEYYVLVLLATLGAQVLVASRHFAALFLGLELLSVSLYALVAYTVTSIRSLEAGIKYLVLAGVSSAFLLFGMALVYAGSGTLVFSELAATPPVVLAGLSLLVAGIAFKLSLVPFHMWTPDVFEGAPAPVGGFLVSVSKAAVAVLLVRMLLTADAFRAPSLTVALAVLAFASMLAGNLLALLQDNIKRMLAYSSIAHVGYLLVAVLVGNAFGVEAVSYYLIAYIAMNLAAFAVVAMRSSGARDGTDPDHIEHYRGLFWQQPGLAGSLSLSLLSLAGIPLTAGFIAKFYVLAAGVGVGWWWLVAGIIVGSAIGLYYYLRFTVYLFLPADRLAPATSRPSLIDNGALTLLALVIIVLGVYPAPLMHWIQTALAARL